MPGQHFLQLVKAVFDAKGVLCRVGIDKLPFRFEKQHLVHRKVKFLIVFIKGQLWLRSPQLLDVLLDFLNRIIHPAAANDDFFLGKILNQLNTNFHSITPLIVL